MLSCTIVEYLLELEVSWIVLLSLNRNSVYLLGFGEVDAERVAIHVCVLHFIVEGRSHSYVRKHIFEFWHLLVLLVTRLRR